MTIKSFDKIDIECFITFCIKIKGNELEISHEDFVKKYASRFIFASVQNDGATRRI